VVSRARASLVAAVVVATAAGIVPSVGCVDEVHEQEVAALGPEQPGVPQGPLHRPGQPCITCHGGSGPASQQLSVGGTVYGVEGQLAPAVGSTVSIEDIDGHVWNGTTNAAGNFFATVQQFSPHYPTQPTVTTADGSIPLSMATHIARDGSCADCHANPAGPTSAGPVYAHLPAAQ
jgi:hypothetical protein